jgi:hypothetical protein
MAKGSKKYSGHEYSFTTPAKSGLGKELDKQKESASAHRPAPKGFSTGGEAKSSNKKAMRHGAYMADGGTATPVVGSGTNSALAAMGAAVSNPQAAVSNVRGKAHGGEMKKKENGVKDIGEDNKAGSVYELGSSYKKGGKVKAEDESQKAKVKGDSKKNDQIPAMLSEGEDVLPRSVTKSKNAPEKAKQFVKKLEDKEKKKK